MAATVTSTCSSTNVDRIAALERYGILDTPPEQAFDDLVQMVSEMFSVPIAAINLVAQNRQWFKSEIGLGVREMPLDDSICAFAILEPGGLEIPDTTQDSRFNCNSLVTGGPRLRFYAGQPLVTPDGHVLGTLCVLDTKPRPEGLAPQQRFFLKTLAQQVMAQLELRRVINEQTNILDERKRIEAELRAERDRSQQLLEGMDEGFIFLDTEFRIRQINAGAMRMENRPRSEMLGRTHWEVWPGSDSLPLADAYRRAMTDRVPVNVEQLYEFPDGRSFWVDVRAYPAEGGLAIFYRNINERKQAEAELYDSRERLQKIIGQAATGVVQTDAEGHFTFVNRTYCNMLGYEEAELLQMGVIDVTPSESLPASVEAIKKVMTGDSSFVIEKQYRRKDGSLMWSKTSVSAIRGPNGEYQGMVAIIVDITDRINAEETLSRSEERFRSLILATSQMIWTTTPDGRVHEDSPSWRSFTGQTYEEWKDYGWLDAVHPDDRERARLAWTESVATKSNYETHYRLRRHDGRYRWTVVKGVPVLNPDGSIREWMGANTDITEQRKTEQALHSSEAQLRLVLDTTQLKIFTAGPNGDVDYHNPAWTDYTGLSFQEVRDWGWVKFIHPDEAENNVRAWRHSIDTGEPFQLEHRFRQADGQYRWHLSRALPLRDQEGRIIKWVGSSTDIHEIKAAETELEVRLAEETRNASLLKQVADASRTLHTALSVDEIAQLLVEQVRSILEVHQAVVSLTESENWAQAINAVSLSDKYACFRSYASKTDGSGIYAEVCRTNKPMRFTQAELEKHPAWKRFGKHASEHPAMRGWLAVPLIGHDGKNLGLIQASDKFEGEFTEQDEAILIQLASIVATGFENARLYESLREQDRRKDEFLAMLAHELRNPLAPISAAAELMGLVKLDETRLKQTSQIITRQIRHMTGLVDDLLDVSRVTRGLVVLNKTDLDIKRVVYEAIEQIHPMIEAKHHHLTVDLGAEPAHVEGDVKRLVQILANLLNNAAKYTPEKGSIHVGMEITGSKVCLNVIDNGIGIAKEMQANVFELFAQEKRSADRSQGGLGIGLALVKSLVELHGGEVSCESEGIGKGSRFTVTLPKLTHSRDETTKQDSSQFSKGLRQLKVLIVDDNVDAASMLAMLLESAGHKVRVEHEPYSAIKTAGEEIPDVCLLDIGLPGMDGKELATRLKADKATSKSVLIALTGYGQEADRKATSAAGFEYHFVKPVNGRQLSELLDTLRDA